MASRPPPPPAGNSLTLNNVTVVPIARLTDEELDFYIALAEKGRAIPIDAPSPRQRPVHRRPTERTSVEDDVRWDFSKSSAN